MSNNNLSNTKEKKDPISQIASKETNTESKTPSNTDNNKYNETDYERISKFLEKLLITIFGSSGLIIGFSLLRTQPFNEKALIGIMTLIFSGLIILVLMWALAFFKSYENINENGIRSLVIFSILLFFVSLIYFLSAITGIGIEILSFLFLVQSITLLGMTIIIFLIFWIGFHFFKIIPSLINRFKSFLEKIPLINKLV
ncbi:MAG: hypothetical protein HeimC3_26340 [Candidatus Heimdallarchaeota archaeon LC_3]|nr:MAG: hypothetical protein HeimC3_26340 [Candidatus Heimdallarchaeota archaeon LC_3]